MWDEGFTLGFLRDLTVGCSSVCFSEFYQLSFVCLKDIHVSFIQSINQYRIGRRIKQSVFCKFLMKICLLVVSSCCEHRADLNEI